MFPILYLNCSSTSAKQSECPGAAAAQPRNRDGQPESPVSLGKPTFQHVRNISQACLLAPTGQFHVSDADESSRLMTVGVLGRKAAGRDYSGAMDKNHSSFLLSCLLVFTQPTHPLLRSQTAQTSAMLAEVV